MFLAAKKHSDGQIPRISVEGQTIPEAWERAVLATWSNGCEIKTQYDAPGDPPSRDCTMIMTIVHPNFEPDIHKCFPGGLEDLEIYRQEVVYGIHDHWIDPTKKSHRWPYTYHDRLFNYNPRYPESGSGINQIEQMVKDLAETPYSRRVEAITWYPWFDPTCADPPCLQRIWCRLLEDEKGRLFLNMNLNMRSWDAFKAAFMNLWAFADLQSMIAEQIGELRDNRIHIGPLTGIGDSFHIYGSYFKDPKLPLSFQGFLESIEKRSWEDRVMSSSDEDVQTIFAEAREKIRNERKEP